MQTFEMEFLFVFQLPPALAGGLLKNTSKMASAKINMTLFWLKPKRICFILYPQVKTCGN
jgi:hypothetical protein